MERELFVRILGAALKRRGFVETTGYEIPDFYGWEAIVESQHPEIEDHGYKLTVFFQDENVCWNVHYVLGMWTTHITISGVGPPGRDLIKEIVRHCAALIF